MQRSFLLGCCPTCDRYKRYMKSTRRGHQKYRKIRNKLNRELRRKMKDNMRNGDYEPVFLSNERWS